MTELYSEWASVMMGQAFNPQRSLSDDSLKQDKNLDYDSLILNWSLPSR